MRERYPEQASTVGVQGTVDRGSCMHVCDAKCFDRNEKLCLVQSNLETSLNTARMPRLLLPLQFGFSKKPSCVGRRWFK